MNYEWKIRQIEAMNEGQLSDVVVTVCFDVAANEDGLTGFAQGDVRLLPPNAESFVALVKLTEDQVVGWAKEALGDAVAAYEGKVQSQIDAQKVAQPKVVPLPWNVA